MPTRMLRDWTDSQRIELLSAEAERMFTRLLMKADDFGRYHADPRMLKASCFPLLVNLREADIARWLEELTGLLHFYQAKGRSYLAIKNFRQRLRQKKAKYPPPDGQEPGWVPPDDGADGESQDRPEQRAESDPGGDDDVGSRVRKFWDQHPKLPLWNAKDHSALVRIVELSNWDEMVACVNVAIEQMAARPGAYALSVFNGRQTDRASVKSEQDQAREHALKIAAEINAKHAAQKSAVMS